MAVFRMDIVLYGEVFSPEDLFFIECPDVRGKIDSIDLSQLDLSTVPNTTIASEFAAFIAGALGISKFNLIPIPDELIYPEFPPHLTRVPSTVPKEYYIKRPSVLGHDGKHTLTAETVLQETKVGEVLMKNPHPNIAYYRGCEVVDGRIRGPFWDRCAMTLHDHLRAEKPLDVEHFLQGLEDGLRHRHNLGYCYNDINESNVLLDDDGNAVIIDFDLCMLQGKTLLKGGGHPGFTLGGMQFSDPKNDMYAFRQMLEHLHGPMTDYQWVDDEDIGEFDDG
ncbi:hypothetical protein EDB82DRAFT_556172 [Fusarium venenatum]|uniref:uncharacterized protein n=1 Tax=Fusarium venenatum TaxID=56646 RepID=UPI001D3B6DCD|nr:hypothetical protein EDB82DRAFT_556172 [Fusarium venenatum]